MAVSRSVAGRGKALAIVALAFLAGLERPLMNLKLVAPLGVVLAVSACAVPTTGPVSRQEGMYTITRQGQGAWVQPMTLTAAATKEAEAHCAGVGKKYKAIHQKETPAGVLGRWPESELLYRCE